jgi:hypothetical protein
MINNWVLRHYKKSSFGGGSLSLSQKRKITDEVYSITEEQAENDYKKLVDLKPNEIDTNTRTGNTFIHYYTSLQRLDTIGRRGLSFFELLERKNEFKKKKSVEKLIKFQLEKNPNANMYKVWYNVFKLYFGSIAIFKPLIAMEIYNKFKPTSILDFTMGWGGRLVGACALNIPNYIGIDLNMDLKKPYQEMVKKLKELGTTTNIKLMFKNALSVDYSKLNYDMVFTSPPYYNIEIYKGTQRQTKDDWDNNFYRPIFEKTYKHLKRGGTYILNIPKEVYERVCIDLFGEANEFIPLNITKSNKRNYEGEFIYIWKK